MYFVSFFRISFFFFGIRRTKAYTVWNYSIQIRGDIRITNRERMEKQNSRRVKIEDSALISRNIYIYGSTRRTRVLPRGSCSCVTGLRSPLNSNWYPRTGPRAAIAITISPGFWNSPLVKSNPSGTRGRLFHSYRKQNPYYGKIRERIFSEISFQLEINFQFFNV